MVYSDYRRCDPCKLKLLTEAAASSTTWLDMGGMERSLDGNYCIVRKQGLASVTFQQVASVIYSVAAMLGPPNNSPVVRMNTGHV